MAEYALLRKGRNALSTVTHIVLNVALAVVSTTLTIISGNWVFGVLLVILSKWRVVAVRPRYWWLNIKANIVDFTVGAALALLVYKAGVDSLNLWHVILTAIYAIWLVIIKPMSSVWATEVQSILAVFLGSFATALIAATVNPIIGVVCCFIIGYGASRHALIQHDDRETSLVTMCSGIALAELFWVFYHWSIVYSLGFGSSSFAIPQLPIVASLLYFVFYRGYRSAARHDGKISADDILIPIIFSVSLMVVMLIFFSNPRFNI